MMDENKRFKIVRQNTFDILNSVKSVLDDSKPKNENGTLKIKVLRGRDLKIVRDSFPGDKQDPYLLVQFGDQNETTEECIEGHDNPKWDDVECNFGIDCELLKAKNLPSLSFSAYDRNIMTDVENLIGKGFYNINKLIQSQINVDEDEHDVSIELDNHCGYIDIKISFILPSYIKVIIKEEKLIKNLEAITTSNNIKNKKEEENIHDNIEIQENVPDRTEKIDSLNVNYSLPLHDSIKNIEDPKKSSKQLSIPELKKRNDQRKKERNLIKDNIETKKEDEKKIISVESSFKEINKQLNIEELKERNTLRKKEKEEKEKEKEKPQNEKIEIVSLSSSINSTNSMIKELNLNSSIKNDNIVSKEEEEKLLLLSSKEFNSQRYTIAELKERNNLRKTKRQQKHHIEQSDSSIIKNPICIIESKNAFNTVINPIKNEHKDQISSPRLASLTKINIPRQKQKNIICENNEMNIIKEKEIELHLQTKAILDVQRVYRGYLIRKKKMTFMKKNENMDEIKISRKKEEIKNRINQRKKERNMAEIKRLKDIRNQIKQYRSNSITKEQLIILEEERIIQEEKFKKEKKIEEYNKTREYKLQELGIRPHGQYDNKIYPIVPMQRMNSSPRTQKLLQIE